ncbi:RpiB/LacA/LacB family sugar-phosphate isomerase [Candidatus Daviesbacteria bacterium]|nr:RpiB/LacA/LacB family sugar-phosphate isomerase [Candidatus Daviesbacteria bacterium]
MVYLATDHAGFELKEKVKEFLQKEGYEVEDCGAFEFDKNDDYPDFISVAAKKVSQDPQGVAIIFGNSGQGEAMVANKYKNVRAALFYGPVLPVKAVDASGRESADPFEMVRLTREHNHANVLSLGASFLTEQQAFDVIKKWLNTKSSGEERHVRRVNKIKQIEENL